MVNLKGLKRYIRQIFAFFEKEFYMELRFKSRIITRFLNPIIRLLILVFIFRTIFSIKTGYSIGYWNGTNYVLFLLIAFCIQFSRSIMSKYDTMFRREKYWKTLSAIMIAPVNRFTLLIGILFSEFMINCLPIAIFFIIALVMFPIPIYFIILTLLVYFLIIVILSSIGLLVSVFSISHEEYSPYIAIMLKIVLLFSCITYPKEIFPEIIQFAITLNPFFYIFDLLRLTWYLGYNYDAALHLITITHLIIILLMAVLTPIISVYVFNRIYKKYGITGF